jgi:hypothetical protein
MDGRAAWAETDIRAVEAEEKKAVPTRLAMRLSKILWQKDHRPARSLN